MEHDNYLDWLLDKVDFEEEEEPSNLDKTSLSTVFTRLSEFLKCSEILDPPSSLTNSQPWNYYVEKQ